MVASPLARCAWLEAPRTLSWREERLGAPGPGQLLCRALTSAISPGTELAAWTGAPPLRPGPAYPRLMGYCHVAEVQAAGPDVRRAAAGDRILSFTSHRSAMLLAEDDCLAVVPPSLAAAEASVAYLFHLGYNAVLRSEVRAGSRVLVLGLGALGIAAVQMARLAGAEVAAVTDQPALAALAKGAGASWAGARGAVGAGPAWLAGGADVVITTSGSWGDWQLALAAAGRRGTIAVLGFPGRGTPPPEENPLLPQHFYQKQLRIEAVGMSPELPDSRGFARWNERDNLAFLLGRLDDGTLDASPFTRHRYPAADLGTVYEALLDREAGQLTAILLW